MARAVKSMLRLTRISACFAGLLGFASAFIAAELPLGEPHNCSSFDTTALVARAVRGPQGRCYCGRPAGVACARGGPVVPEQLRRPRSLPDERHLRVHPRLRRRRLLGDPRPTARPALGAARRRVGRVCDAGYAGADYSAVVPTCPLSCSARGRCVDGAARIDGSVGRCGRRRLRRRGCELAINPCPLGLGARRVRPRRSAASAAPASRAPRARCGDDGRLPRCFSAHGEASRRRSRRRRRRRRHRQGPGGPSLRGRVARSRGWAPRARAKPPRGCERGCSGRGTASRRGNTFESASGARRGKW